MNDIKTLTILMTSESRTAWNTLLQKGFYVYGKSGVSVRQFLMETMHYDDCFIDEVVRTVFLNNSPVDNIDTAQVKDGDKMALGSAMPGLVGICMGRDNPYKSFRSGISIDGEEGGGEAEAEIRVSMKVFSNLAVDTGADILSRGIEVEAGKVADLFSYKGDCIVDDGGFAALSADRDDLVRVIVNFQ